MIHSPLSDPFFSTASSRTASWTWHTQAPAGSYLTCSLLDHFAHGFWSRQAYPQTPFELTPMLTPIAGATTYRVKQVHGDRVVNCGNLTPVISSELPELVNADGLWGTQPQQALWTCTADCTPVLIGDVRTGAASTVHSGWRGTSMRIVPKAIALLESQGSQRDDLRIALGPAIDGTVYQVAEEVGVEVVNSVWQDWASPSRPDLLTNLAIVHLLNWQVFYDAERILLIATRCQKLLLLACARLDSCVGVVTPA